MELGSSLTHDNVSWNYLLSKSLFSLKTKHTLRISLVRDIWDWNHDHSVFSLLTGYAQIGKRLVSYFTKVIACLEVKQKMKL